MLPIIAKKELLSWLGGLQGQGKTVVAPVKTGEVILFGPVKSVNDILLDYHNSTLSPKDWFFPPTDSLFTLERKDGHSQLLPSAVIPDSVMFGIRPCDARALRILDFPFLEEPADAIYARRRLRTTLLGIACTEVEPQCFCDSLGGAPDSTSDVDILLTPSGDDYIVQIVTEKGKSLIASAKLSESEISLPKPPEQRKVPAEGIKEAATRIFDDPFWDTVADRCLHCNICAYVCPTCYCFDIRDSWENGNIERIRTWESCQSPAFTRIAGGYDPRPTKGKRLRQRFCHKLLYFPEEFGGTIACVGCGRCVISCPVNIDIREVISEIQKRGGRVDSTRA